MSTFCSSCGFPLAAGSGFCPKCGARLAYQPAPPAAAPMMAPAPVAKSSSGLKIVLIIFGVLAFLGIAAVAGVVYVTHRVKEAVVSTAKEHGVDLNQIASAVQADTATSSHSSAPRRKACDYLSKEQVSVLIGQPIERAVADDSACQYFGPPGLAAKLGKESLSTGMNSLEADQKGNAQIAQGLNNVINGLGAQRGEEMPLIQFIVDPDGKSQMAALDLAGGVFGGIPGAKPQEIPGLGDRAVRIANLGLNVIKGNTMIRIVAGPIPDPDAKTIAVAKAILPLV